MIQKLSIQNFRGLKNISIPHLARVNIVVGENDTGKTSLLEAITLASNDWGILNELPGKFRPCSRKGETDYWRWSFINKERKAQFLIKFDTGESAELCMRGAALADGMDLHRWRGAPDQPAPVSKIHLRTNVEPRVVGSPPGFDLLILSTAPVSMEVISDKYGRVAAKAKGEDEVYRAMQAVEPRLEKLRYLPSEMEESIVYAYVSLSEGIPVSQMGQAFYRLLFIYSSVISSGAKLLLVDEIENGVFSGSLPKIWGGLFKMCEDFDIQLIATTHSRECVMAATAAAKERGKSELLVHRLQRVKGELEAVTLDMEELDLASRMGLEVRS
jgi:hypothetical protein